jgi:hypothetical protein
VSSHCSYYRRLQWVAVCLSLECLGSVAPVSPAGCGTGWACVCVSPLENHFVALS